MSKSVFNTVVRMQLLRESKESTKFVYQARRLHILDAPCLKHCTSDDNTITMIPDSKSPEYDRVIKMYKTRVCPVCGWLVAKKKR